MKKLVVATAALVFCLSGVYKPPPAPLGATAAITRSATAYPDNDPDLLRYPAPELHPQITGCVTVHGKGTISDWPYVSRICIGDTQKRRTLDVLRSLICFAQANASKTRLKT